MPWKCTARFAVVNPPATSAADSRCAACLPWSLLRSMVLRKPPPAVAESPSNFRETRYPPPAVPLLPSSPGARAIPPCKFAKKPPPAVTPSAPPNLSAPALTACAARLPACSVAALAAADLASVSAKPPRRFAAVPNAALPPSRLNNPPTNRAPILNRPMFR